MEDNNKIIKKQSNDLITRFVFTGILGWMIIELLIVVVNVGYIVPQISDGKNIFEVFNPNFSLLIIVALIVFQFILIFATYNLGVSRFLKKTEVASYEKLSKNSLISSIVICFILSSIAFSRIDGIFATYNFNNAINDFVDSYMEVLFSSGEVFFESDEALSQSGEALSQSGEALSQSGETVSQSGESVSDILGNSVNNILEVTKQNITNSDQFMKNLTLKYLFGEVIFLGFLAFYNHSFFKKYKNKEI